MAINGALRNLSLKRQHCEQESEFVILIHQKKIKYLPPIRLLFQLVSGYISNIISMPMWHQLDQTFNIIHGILNVL